MMRQQKWAQGALECVVARRGKTDEGKLRTLYMKMPGLIQQSGLVQALVFVNAREGESGKAFLGELARVYGVQGVGDALALIGHAQKAAPLSKYMAITRDLSAVAMWFRRFAQSELRGSAEGGRDDGTT